MKNILLPFIALFALMQIVSAEPSAEFQRICNKAGKIHAVFNRQLDEKALAAAWEGKEYLRVAEMLDGHLKSHRGTEQQYRMLAGAYYALNDGRKCQQAMSMGGLSKRIEVDVEAARKLVDENMGASPAAIEGFFSPPSNNSGVSRVGGRSISNAKMMRYGGETKEIFVRAYTKKDGTFVRSHTRRRSGSTSGGKSSTKRSKKK